MNTTNPNTTQSFQSASLYVGDLHTEVTEAVLFDIFNAVGPVASIRVCRDNNTRRSLGYAYVNFHNMVDAERALDTMNYTPIKGKPCRIMWCHRDPSIRKSGSGNIFIKNLDKSIDNKALYDTFSVFGNILSCKVVTDDNAQSRGYGFVHYETVEFAELAIQKVNSMLLVGKKVFVGHFVPKKTREGENPHNIIYTNVYIKNLDPSYDENKLAGLFAPFGKATNIIVMRNDDKTSKGFGFINFEKPEYAMQAVANMMGHELPNKQKLYVARAQKKIERETELRNRFERIKQERINKYQGVNLYIKNLDDTIDDSKLKEAFINYGTITSAKVMKDDKENSKGFGFVCYQTAEEATKAVTEMNGKSVGSKPIYVALAQRKEVRRAQLEAQHRQNGMRLPPMQGQLYNMPVFYPRGGPSYPPAVYTAQQMAMPRTARWPMGPPQQPQPGRANNYPLSSNYQAPRRGSNRRVTRGGGNQLINGANNIRRNVKFTPNVRNPRDQGQQQGHGGPPIPEPSNEPLSTFKTTLASQQPDRQKHMLGERLFPLIQNRDQNQAGKITGMLLESLDQSELLNLLESPDLLQGKITEALQVLDNANKIATAQNPHDREEKSNVIN